MSPLSSWSKEPHRGSSAAPGGGSSGPTLPKDFQRARRHHTLRLYPKSQVEEASEFGAAHQAPTQSVWFGLYGSSYKWWRPSRALHGQLTQEPQRLEPQREASGAEAGVASAGAAPRALPPRS